MANVEHLSNAAPDMTIKPWDLYLNSLEHFEESVDHIMVICESARQKLDDLGRVVTGLNELASGELNLEITDWKRVREKF